MWFLFMNFKPSLEQRAIAEAAPPFVEVTAVPGAGKSSTLVARVAHLMTHGTAPEQILVLSFSNSTVFLVEEKLKAVGSAGVNVKTCHALALSIVQKNYKKLGFAKLPKIAGNGHALLLATVLTQLKTRYRKKSRKLAEEFGGTGVAALQEFLEHLADAEFQAWFLQFLSVSRLSVVKPSKLLTKPEYAFARPYAAQLKIIYRAFMKAKDGSTSLDFSDILVHAARLLEKGVAVRGYAHVLVDEYQDCSAAQAHFLAALGKRVGRLMVFGDKLQNIYGFSGASYCPLSTVLPDVVRFPLSKSFRLHQGTADFAATLMDANGLPRPVIVGRVAGEKPVFSKYKTYGGEVEAVAEKISNLIAGGVDPSQIAVLARVKSVATAVGEELRGLGVGSARDGLPTKFRHVRTVLKLVKMCERVKSKNDIDGKSVLHATGITCEDQLDLKRAVSKARIALRSLSMEGRFKVCTAAYMALQGGQRNNKDMLYGISRWTNICRRDDCRSAQEMLRVLDEWAAQSEVFTGSVHRAKGGEWDYVFIVGATEGLFPYYKAVEEGKLGEEVNLMYVAATRARKKLFISYGSYVHARARRACEGLSRLLSKPCVLQKTVSGNPR